MVVAVVHKIHISFQYLTVNFFWGDCLFFWWGGGGVATDKRLGGQFPIQKFLPNPSISKLMFSVFCRLGETTLKCTLQGPRLGRVL